MRWEIKGIFYHFSNFIWWMCCTTWTEIYLIGKLSKAFNQSVPYECLFSNVVCCILIWLWQRLRVCFWLSKICNKILPLGGLLLILYLTKWWIDTPNDFMRWSPRSNSPQSAKRMAKCVAGVRHNIRFNKEGQGRAETFFLRSTDKGELCWCDRTGVRKQ